MGPAGGISARAQCQRTEKTVRQASEAIRQSITEMLFIWR